MNTDSKAMGQEMEEEMIELGREDGRDRTNEGREIKGVG